MKNLFYKLNITCFNRRKAEISSKDNVYEISGTKICILTQTLCCFEQCFFRIYFVIGMFGCVLGANVMRWNKNNHSQSLPLRRCIKTPLTFRIIITMWEIPECIWALQQAIMLPLRWKATNGAFDRPEESMVCLQKVMWALWHFKEQDISDLRDIKIKVLYHFLEKVVFREGWRGTFWCKMNCDERRNLCR